MADLKEYIPFLFEWEGVNYEDENSGTDQPTKFGVIVDDLKQLKIDENGDGRIDYLDVKALNANEATNIIHTLYWNYFKADQIDSQSVAEAIVDFGFNTGNVTSAKRLQKILGVDADGKIGPKTIAAINAQDHKALFSLIQRNRTNYYIDIVANKPSLSKYKNGWNNRINALKFKR